MTIALLFAGFGHVARRFVHLLDETRADLRALGIEPVVVGIVTRSHGSVYADAGLDARRAADEVAGGAVLGPASSPSAIDCITRMRALRAEARVLIEATTLDVRSGEPATAYVRAAIAAGVHVITANKGPCAFAYRALAAEAAAARVSLLFEGAVMDGVPLFSLVRETMPAVHVRGFRAVLNSTTNFILTALERGEPFDAALARMQALGVAEADPSLDLDGWDAAAKTAILANVLLDADLTPLTIGRDAIGDATGARARAALVEGRRLKLVASAAGRGNAVDARVELQALDLSDPLAQLDGQANAIELETWPLGRVVITQRDGGLEKTAYALLSDLCTIARRLERAS